LNAFYLVNPLIVASLSEKKRIAFLCHPYHRGGVTRWIADAAIAASNDGREVYFITVAPVSEFVSAKGRETLLQLLAARKSGVQIITAKVGYEFEFGTPGYRAYVYSKLLVQVPPGTPVVLADDEVLWQAAASLHGAYPVVGVLHADEDVYYNLAKKYYPHTDVLACVSNRVNKTVREWLPQTGIPGLYTIPCGINLPPVVQGAYSQGILQLVYVGRITNYQKRAGDLVKICSLLKEKQVPFHLNIIGDGGADKTALENKVVESGLQQQVTFCGWLSQAEVTRHLSQSDILLLTSDFEGTPIAMMEALAAGCGMVGTRVSGIEDYEHHPLAADCLSVYEVGDIEDAVSKVIKVAAIPATTKKQAARKLAEAEFTMQVCLQRYYKAIDAIPPRKEPPQRITLSLTALLYSKTIAIARYLKVNVIKEK
jgi:glycosyltransferase involved in cell wall biosynthesis